MPQRILEVVKRDQRIIQVNTSETALPSIDLAINVNYDNTSSQLPVTNVQNAIDWLEENKQEVLPQDKVDLLLDSTAPFTQEEKDKLAGFDDPENYLTTDTIIAGTQGGLIVGGGSLIDDVINLDVDLAQLPLGVDNIALGDTIPVIREDGTQLRLDLNKFQSVSGFKLMGYCKPVTERPDVMEICDRNMIGTGQLLEKEIPPPLDPSRPNRDGYAYEVLLDTFQNQVGVTSTLEGTIAFESSHVFKYDIFVWVQDNNLEVDGKWGLLSTGASLISFNGRNGDIIPTFGDYSSLIIPFGEVVDGEVPPPSIHDEISSKAYLGRDNVFSSKQQFVDGIILPAVVELPQNPEEGQIVMWRDETNIESPNSFYGFTNGVWGALGGTGGGGLTPEIGLLELRVAELEEKVVGLEAELEKVPKFFELDVPPEDFPPTVDNPEPLMPRNGDTWYNTETEQYFVRLANNWVLIHTGVGQQTYAEDVLIDKPEVII